MTARSRHPIGRVGARIVAARPPDHRTATRKGNAVLTRRKLLKSATGAAAGPAVPLGLYRPASTPAAVQGFATPLPRLPKARPVAANRYLITARAGATPMHPSFGPTRVFGYDDNSGRGVASPGYTIEVRKGTPTRVDYVNALPARH